MGRPRKHPPHIEYIEIGFSHGFRWRIDPRAQQVVEYERLGGLETMNGKVSLEAVAELLRDEQAKHATPTTEESDAG